MPYTINASRQIQALYLCHVYEHRKEALCDLRLRRREKKPQNTMSQVHNKKMCPTPPLRGRPFAVHIRERTTISRPHTSLLHAGCFLSDVALLQHRRCFTQAPRRPRPVVLLAATLAPDLEPRHARHGDRSFSCTLTRLWWLPRRRRDPRW